MLNSNILKNIPALRNKHDAKKLIYFDNACSQLKPQQTIDAINDYYLNYSCCGGGRSSHYLARKVDERVFEIREKIKIFLGAREDDHIIFTSGTTDGLNLLSRSFIFKKSKNEVLLSDLEHNSNLLPFLEIEKEKKIKIRIVKTRDGQIDLSDFEKKISKKTALVSFSQSSNVINSYLDLKKISKIALLNEAKVLVDSAQYISSNRSKFSNHGIDFLVFSAHKVGGPTGLGIICVKDNGLKFLKNFKVGGGTVKNIDFNKNIMPFYLPYHRGNEPGILNLGGIFGLEGTIDHLNKIGIDNIKKHVENLILYLYKELKSVEGIIILNPKKTIEKGAVLSFYFKEKDVSENDFNIFLNNGLDKHIIALRVGQHCANLFHSRIKVEKSIRVSFAYYNSKKEIDIFMSAIRKFLKLYNS